MTTGFIFIITQTGFVSRVRGALDEIELVVGRWGLFGEFDLLARIEAEGTEALTRCIVEEIRMIEGIVDTRTLIGAEI